MMCTGIRGMVGIIVFSRDSAMEEGAGNVRGCHEAGRGAVGSTAYLPLLIYRYII